MEQQAELSFTSEPQRLGKLWTEKASTRRPLASRGRDTKSREERDSSTPLSVTALTRRVAALLEGEIGEVWIEGEISNYRLQSSGHHYFTLKDAHAQIASVLFAGTAATLPRSLLNLADGMAVQIHGAVTVYQPRGQYQLIVRLIQHRGAGLLQAKFEALKKRLAAEGLFNGERKRPLPRFPQRIGVVTSPTAAGLADFLKVLYRRHPGLQVVIYPVRVQGRGAADEIIHAIEQLSAQTAAIGRVDVIVVTRGGGSLEDLWEFNEESVARAIVASSVPVISAVGHEIDYTISDFAADVRAPTPSAAAELLAVDRVHLLESAARLLKRLERELLLQRNHLLHRFEQGKMSSLFREPERRCWTLQQSLDLSTRALERALRYQSETMRATWSLMVSRLREHHPAARLQQAADRQRDLQRQLSDQLYHQRQRLYAHYERLHASLRGLSPHATLARGFTITRNEQGEIVSSTATISAGEQLSTQFSDGRITSVVTAKKSGI